MHMYMHFLVFNYLLMWPLTGASYYVEVIFSLHIYRGPPEPEHTTNIEKVTVDVLRGLTSLVIIIATAQNIHNWLIEV